MNTLDTLRCLYNQYRKKFRKNPDSDQICCMWSTSNPPHDIFNSDQIYSIEKAFDIELTEDEAMEIYDMELEEAVSKIDEIRRRQC